MSEVEKSSKDSGIADVQNPAKFLPVFTEFYTYRLDPVGTWRWKSDLTIRSKHIFSFFIIIT